MIPMLSLPEPGGGAPMRSESAARALFVVLLAVTVYLMYLIFKPFLPGIAWATVLAVAFWPTYDRLTRLLRGRAWTAAVLMSALLALLVVVPSVIAVIEVGQGIADGYTWLEAKYATDGWDLGLTRELPWAKDLVEWFGNKAQIETLDLKGMALSALKTVGTTLARSTGGLVSNAISTLMTLAVVLVTMAVLFKEGPTLIAIVRRFAPLSEKDRDEVFAELRNVTRSVFFGVLLTALVQAIVGGVGWAIAGLPAATTFGAVMFFAALLPVGTVLVWGPGALWLLASGSPWGALFLLLWGIGVVASTDNFLRPLFIGRGVKMSMILVFFGILGGMLAFGLVGLFVGPLVITLFIFLLEVARRDFFRTAAVEEPGQGPGAAA